MRVIDKHGYVLEDGKFVFLSALGQRLWSFPKVGMLVDLKHRLCLGLGDPQRLDEKRERIRRSCLNYKIESQFERNVKLVVLSDWEPSELNEVVRNPNMVPEWVFADCEEDNVKRVPVKLITPEIRRMILADVCVK